MFRYFCLLYLLICIELVICYDYRDFSDENYYRRDDALFRKGRNGPGNLKHTRLSKLQRDVLAEIKSPVAQFDVSSFIQNPAEGSEEDKIQRTSKDEDYGFQPGLNVDENNKRYKEETSLGTNNAPELNSNPSFLKNKFSPRHLNLNSFSFEDMNSQKHMRGNEAAKGKYYHEIFSDRNNIHKPEKKCALKHLKFPFFSHSKPGTKPKKEKKQKKICTNCSKKEESYGIPQGIQNFYLDGYKVNKRSYEEMLCPECRRKFINYDRVKHSSQGMIHDSRQFYQHIKGLAGRKSKESKHSDNILNKENLEVVTFPNKDDINKAKRDKFKHGRLKELDED